MSRHLVGSATGWALLAYPSFESYDFEFFDLEFSGRSLSFGSYVKSCHYRWSAGSCRLSASR